MSDDEYLLPVQQEMNVDKKTGNFYFWLGQEGENTKASFLSKEDFENMLRDLS